MKYKVVLDGFPTKEMAEAFVRWYLGWGEDEFNRPDTWQQNEGEGIWGWDEKQNLQWDNDSIAVTLKATKGVL
jgi:hypothetical protein